MEVRKKATVVPEEQIPELVQEVIGMMMQELAIDLPTAIKTLSNHWVVTTDSIKRNLRNSKFDSSKQSFIMAITESGEEISVSNYLYLSSQIIASRIKKVIDKTGCDVYEASVGVLDWMNIPITEHSMTVVGECLRARAKYIFSDKTWVKGLGKYKRQMEIAQHRGADIGKVVGSIGRKALNVK